MTKTPPCPLCDCDSVEDYFSDGSFSGAPSGKRDYLRCTRCDLVFVPASDHLNAEGEKAIYGFHQNDPMDAGYRTFLNRLAAPLAARLPPGSHGLDFGCGPGPSLSVLMAEQGFLVDNYDVFYCRDQTVFDKRYDFVTASEVLEHLRRPGEELERLWALIRPGGWLAVMTELRPDQQPFSGWYYRRDPTHVCLYSETTMRFIASAYGAEIERLGRVSLLRKPAGSV